LPPPPLPPFPTSTVPFASPFAKAFFLSSQRDGGPLGLARTAAFFLRSLFFLSRRLPMLRPRASRPRNDVGLVESPSPPLLRATRPVHLPGGVYSRSPAPLTIPSSTFFLPHGPRKPLDTDLFGFGPFVSVPPLTDGPRAPFDRPFPVLAFPSGGVPKV